MPAKLSSGTLFLTIDSIGSLQNFWVVSFNSFYSFKWQLNYWNILKDHIGTWEYNSDLENPTDMKPTKSSYISHWMNRLDSLLARLLSLDANWRYVRPSKSAIPINCVTRLCFWLFCFIMCSASSMIWSIYFWYSPFIFICTNKGMSHLPTAAMKTAVIVGHKTKTSIKPDFRFHFTWESTHI